MSFARYPGIARMLTQTKGCFYSVFQSFNQNITVLAHGFYTCLTLPNQLDNSSAISSTNFTLSGDQEINKTAFQ